ncbi:MAG: hypothetical protein QOD75_1738 [Blastocatellia bacterium]|nr:hypothetical protein [Blastocatellia bacterium]
MRVAPASTSWRASSRPFTPETLRHVSVETHLPKATKTCYDSSKKETLMTASINRSDDILGGTPVFAGTRVPVQSLFDYLEGGDTLDEFLDDFPAVSREHALKILERMSIQKVEQ